VLKACGVLVRTHYSVVSSGTEGMKVREGRLSKGHEQARFTHAALATVFDHTADLAAPITRLLPTPRAQPASARTDGRINLG
jgi:hypothetical protein